MTPNSRLLIVDDDPIELENLEDLFAPQGYDLALAANGRQALAKAVEFNPDLILLDVMMPDMDGFEVCRRLRADPATAEVPIVLVTALADRDSRLQGIKAGADDFVSKPFDSVELRARVQAITRLNRYRRLLAERSKFERVVEYAETGYVLLNDQDRILFANPEARLYLDWPEHRGQPIAESFLTLAQRQYRCEPKEAWADWPQRPPEKMLRFLVRPESATAQAFWLQVDTLDYLPIGPEPTWIVSLRDVTVQMTSQRDRRKFHTMVYHKLRTPFISILSGLELLDRHSQELSRDEIAELSRDAYKWAKRLYEDIEEILRYVDLPASTEPGRGFSLMQLPFVVAQVCASMGLPPASVSGGEDSVGMRSSLSKSAVELMLWEILGNSKKFHPKQQPVINVSVSYDNNSEATIRVSDDGISLSPEQLAQAWTPYYQGEKYFTGQVDGMGLGLPMVAALMWSVGGRCHIFNCSPGPGVTVELGLPLERGGQKG